MLCLVQERILSSLAGTAICVLFAVVLLSSFSAANDETDYEDTDSVGQVSHPS